jgi:hypothetical protein
MHPLEELLELLLRGPGPVDPVRQVIFNPAAFRAMRGLELWAA